MGDVGLTVQRYSMVLYGNEQQLKIEPWEPEIQRTAMVPFEWKPDTWYHLKLRVENMPDGKVTCPEKRGPPGAGAGGVDDREDRPDRQSGGRAGSVRRRRSSGRTSII